MWWGSQHTSLYNPRESALRCLKNESATGFIAYRTISRIDEGGRFGRDFRKKKEWEFRRIPMINKTGVPARQIGRTPQAHRKFVTKTGR